VKTVFITGAGGFAGSHLLKHLRNNGYEVVAGVRNRARKLAYERRNDRALVCDVTDPINVARAIASVRPDAVIHLAGISRPQQATAEPLEAYQAIVTAWANVLDAVRRAVPRARVVLVSACDVYGNAGRDGHPITEDTPANPTTTFGSLKATAENIAHTFYRDYHLNVTIARPFHYTGPGQPGEFFFSAVASRLAETGPGKDPLELTLPDLNCRRDLLHIDDVVRAYKRLLEDGRPNEAYNVCSGQTYTCRELVEAMIAACGGSASLREAAGDEDSAPIPNLCGSPRKLQDELGWRPTRTGLDAVRDLLAGYRSQVVESRT
jgi:GDP-4-dehydro-6-deoxy-D-mannose reductase